MAKVRETDILIGRAAAAAETREDLPGGSPCHEPEQICHNIPSRDRPKSCAMEISEASTALFGRQTLFP